MRLYCWFCGKSVSNDVPKSTVLRAVCVCPECVPTSIREEAKPARGSLFDQPFEEERKLPR